MGATIPLTPREKEIEAGFYCPSFKPTLNEALLVAFTSLGFLSVLSYRKKLLPIPSKLLGAVMIPSACFGLYKVQQRAAWEKSGKEALLSSKGLGLDELEMWGDQLTPEERAFLIREDFSGDLSYNNLLERHGEERVAALFAEGKNVQYREPLKAKLLQQINEASNIRALLQIASFPGLELSREEYEEHMNSSLDVGNFEKNGWACLLDETEYPNYGIVRMLIDQGIAVPRERAWGIYSWLEVQMTKGTFQSRLCYRLVLDGDTAVHHPFQEAAWQLTCTIPDKIIPILCEIPGFRPRGWDDLIVTSNECSTEQFTNLITHYRLELNTNDVSKSPLMRAIGSSLLYRAQGIPSLVEALVNCGASVLDKHIEAAIDTNDPAIMKALMQSSTFDINRCIQPTNSDQKKPPIVYAILESTEAAAQVLWQHPKLNKSIQWNGKDLQTLAGEYRVSLGESVVA